MKKQLVILISCSLLLCAASSWFAYRRGLTEGFTAAAAPNDMAKFVTSLANLRRVRANQTQPIIDSLETSCYSGANLMLQLGYQKGRPSLNKEIMELVSYRAQYAKPSEQWSPVERDLADRLKLWQRGGSTEVPLDASELAQLAYDVKHPQRL